MSTGRMTINYMAFLTVPSQKLAHWKEDPIYVFPEMKLQGLILNDFNNFKGSGIWEVKVVRNMSNAWVLAPIVVIDILFSLKFAAILE